MTSGSKLDNEVFNEFKDQIYRLNLLANEIKIITSNPELKEKINTIEEDDLTLTDSFQEGGILYKLHKVRERASTIVKLKKVPVFELTGKLACESCLFEFEEHYGKIGSGFIECHHIIPLNTFKVEKKTTLSDLALVCSNCHRMLHVGIDKITTTDLQNMIKYEMVPITRSRA